MGAFMDDLKEQGQEENVVILMFSEFGRRIRDNGAGTDHGSGGAANGVGGGRTHLGHEHDGEVLCGRDAERRGGGSAPVVLAWDTEPTEHGGVEHARKAEA